MPITDVGIVGYSNQHRIRQVDSQEVVNWYPEIEDPRAKAPLLLLPTPGLNLYRTIDYTGATRALHVTAHNDKLYAVVGSHFVEVNDSVAGYVVRGTLKSGTGPVSIADNGQTGHQILIVDGERGYIFDTTSLVFRTISAFPAESGSGSSHVIFFDGYFIVNETGTGRWYYSALYDGTTWDPTSVYTAEGSPDNILAIAKTAQEIWLFGSLTTEMWYNTGTGFARIGNAFIEIGTGAAHSVATTNAHMFWLGSNVSGTNAVFHALGFNPNRVSTPCIEYQISQMPRVDDAIGMCYQQEGHTFYILTFPIGNQTWVYDLEVNAWHQRTWYNEDTERVHRHRASCHVLHAGKNYVGDRETGKIYQLDPDTYTDNGGKIQRVRTCPPTAELEKNLFFSDFQLDLEKGVGTVAFTRTLAASALDATFSSDTTTTDWTGSSLLTLVDGTWGSDLRITPIDSTNALTYYGRDSSTTNPVIGHAWLSPVTAVSNAWMDVNVNARITDSTDIVSNALWIDTRRNLATSAYYECRLDYTNVSGDGTTTASIVKWNNLGGGGFAASTMASVRIDPDYSSFFDVSVTVKGTSGDNQLTMVADGTRLPWIDKGTGADAQGNIRVGLDAKTDTTGVLCTAIRSIDATTYYSTEYREPQAMLRWSEDGGMTWGPERWQGFGRIGEYHKTCRWRRLGAGKNRVFRLTISDPVRSAIIASHVTVEGEDL